MRTLIEPFAGLGAVGLHLRAGVRPPASRIGCKAGYAAQIAEHVGPVDRVDWSDADPSLVAGLRAMIEGVDLTPWLGGDPRERWQAAREARYRDPGGEPYPDAPRTLCVPGVWTAAAEAGAAVVLLSERAEVYPLPGGAWHRLHRTGQTRRSLTTSDAELVNVWRRP